MFRSLKYSSSKKEAQSSLSSGNASIKRPAIITTVEQFNEPMTDSPIEEEEIQEEIIDLQAPSTPEELTLESMSAVIAAAVQMSTSGGAPSSLSIGNASILQPFSKTEKKRRFSSIRLFSNSWRKSTSAIASPSSPSTPSLEPSSPFDDDSTSSQSDSPRSSSVSGHNNMNKFDDGRDELIYRGIQIKEIKSTVKPLVISDEERFPMPEVKLERPGFARINY